MSFKKITVAVLILATLVAVGLCGCKKDKIDPEVLGNYTVNTSFFSVFAPRGWKVSRTVGPRTASVDMYEYAEDKKDVDKRVRVQVKPAVNDYTEEMMTEEFKKTIKRHFGSPLSKVKLGDTTYYFSSWLIYDVMDADKFDLDDEGFTSGAKEVATEAPVGTQQTTSGDGAKVRVNTKNRTELIYFDAVNRKRVTVSVVGSLETEDIQSILDSVKLTLDGSGENTAVTAAPETTTAK